MKSKKQKSKELTDTRGLFEKAKSLVFVNFSKTPVAKVAELKAGLRNEGGAYKVMKKRLYNILFKEKNLSVDMSQFDNQFAAIFSDKDISNPAGAAFRFAKSLEKDGSDFSLLGGADMETGVVYSAQDISRIGNLPSREILLAQLAGMLNTPMKLLAYTLSEIGKNKS
ncbi:50S ribosomal protein L10 [Candidatus Wolfebacteria bacterium RIFCSPHIGHO2_01_FULL_48_22]|uniref:Large ribosomal subunit protein uL10 n=2 Tax=Candidatus Wolfeibacteriota TaxID=1752735 RepID=A0A1F8DRM7_9BACT|nr:MAG: 50S ribosomal protein L10 [Candidatus Wolfebacteria bacterium RIFCSPHIGHO2_01_FULL_48_22]OGM92208.1 MAG: 50S ribosomal protein L10 [Candidatus Wolfebacteria bacterium RIFCSPLOWO2_01_FULL_47_17b]